MYEGACYSLIFTFLGPFGRYAAYWVPWSPVFSPMLLRAAQAQVRFGGIVVHVIEDVYFIF